jgi:hypothetical protein
MKAEGTVGALTCLPSIGHFCRKPNTQSFGPKKSFSVGLYPKNVGTNKIKGFLGNSWACESENRLQIVHTNRPKPKQNKVFC